MKNMIMRFLAGAALFVLSGCVPYQKIVRTEFPQGKRDVKQRDIIGRNLRNMRILDEYSTDIELDALWMSDEVRELYVDMKTRKEARDDETSLEMLTTHLEKNDNALTFYVLAYTPENHRSDLHDKDPFWSLYLKMPDGKKRRATSIKEVDGVDLDPIIKEMFGHRLTQYKRAFIVTFPVAPISLGDLPGKDVKMHLVARSAQAKGMLTWELGVDDVKKHTLEDYYWIEYL